MDLLKGVRQQDGRYYLIRRESGKLRRYPLSRVAAGEAALRAAIQSVPPRPNTPPTIEHLLRDFVCHGLGELAAETQREYSRCALSVLVPFKLNEQAATLGSWQIVTLHPGHVAQMLERFRREGRAVLGNRCRSVLSSAFEYGMRAGIVPVEKANPCRGVKRNRERPSRVYVTDEQYQNAIARAPAALRDITEAAYLSGLRQTDLRFARKAWITPQGLDLTESKTGKNRRIRWTPALREVIDRACVRSPDSPFIFTNARGERWRKWALQSAWKRLAPGFAFRQLRPKAQTDGGGRNVLGHTGQMLARYTRREELEPVR